MRPQYTREKCGACGKKMAYVNIGYLGCGQSYDVTCMSCKANLFFTQFKILDSCPVWPGTLVAAAALLHTPKTPEEPNA